MKLKTYFILMLLGLGYSSTSLKAQNQTERQIVEQALRVWLENEKIKCATSFNKETCIDNIYYGSFERQMKDTIIASIGYMDSHLLQILHTQSLSLSKRKTPLGEIGKIYYETLDSCLIHLPSIIDKDEIKVFTIGNLYSIIKTLDDYTMGSYIKSYSKDVINLK